MRRLPWIASFCTLLSCSQAGHLTLPDADGDGFASNEDCDDSDASINPDAFEVCDGLDNNCDDLIDGAGSIGMSTWYLDADGDGFGDPASSTDGCTPGDGYVETGADCNDGDATINPDADDPCDGVDNDCDGVTDPEGGGGTYYVDADGDGYGAGEGIEACSPGKGYSELSSDCDDGDSTVYPGAPETCTSGDSDCDGLSGNDDPDVTGETVYYRDSDGDGYGNPSVTINACDPPGGYTTNSTDCNDADRTVAPGLVESCDGKDNDCDGSTDEDLTGTEAACAAESCAAILAENPSAADGLWWLDPAGSGDARQWTCDMETDGGGWTLVVDWDRETEGDTIGDFESLFSELANTMGGWQDASESIKWCDYDATNDVMAYQVTVTVPNGGESMLDLHYTATGMSQSGTAFWLTADGADNDIVCRINDVTSTRYSSEALSYMPDYTCSSTSSGTWSFEDVYVNDAGSNIDELHVGSWHRDTLWGDQSDLYYLRFWVR